MLSPYFDVAKVNNIIYIYKRLGSKIVAFNIV